MSKQKLPTFLYLQFVPTHSGHKVKLISRITNEVITVKPDKANDYHHNGQLYNLHYGNNFGVDYYAYIDALAFKVSLNAGFKIKFKNGLTYSATKNRKSCSVSTEALRKFYPELL